MSADHRLVLWDIDHTLINAAGLGALCYADAFAAVTGRTLEHREDMGGRTDRDLATATFTRHGLPVTEAVLREFFTELDRVTRGHGAFLRERGHALPGAADALRDLAAMPGVVQSVVTGNVTAVAAWKLAAYGLDAHLDLAVGGYGEEHGTRPALVRLAHGRAERKYGVRYRPGSVVVVGDTALDVAGARAAGALAVGVATGRTSVGDLRAAGAHAVLPDLTDLTEITGLIRSADTGSPVGTSDLFTN